jgi:hypothetical protein
METEGSGAVWLLAALLKAYSDQEAPVFEKPEHVPPPGRFSGWAWPSWARTRWGPEPLLQGYWSIVPPEHLALYIEQDAELLASWLAYARKRLPAVERYGFWLLLVGIMQGENRGALPKLMSIYESRAA